MHAAIDIDGTLTGRPAVFAPLIRALLAAGWEVTLLAGWAGQRPESADLAALKVQRRQQIAPYHLGPVRLEIVVAQDGPGVAAGKGRFCRDAGVGLLIDDNRGYCVLIAEISPDTAVCNLLN